MRKVQVLKVLPGDGGDPITNVPRSVAAEDHHVLEQTRSGDHWAVLIEKRERLNNAL